MPDHSTFSKNRHGRFRESDLLRKLFGEPSLLVWVIARVVRQNSAVGKLDLPAEIMGDRHDGLALLIDQVAQDLEYLFARFGIEGAGRLVGQDEGRIVGERPGTATRWR